MYFNQDTLCFAKFENETQGNSLIAKPIYFDKQGTVLTSLFNINHYDFPSNIKYCIPIEKNQIIYVHCEQVIIIDSNVQYIFPDYKCEEHKIAFRHKNKDTSKTLLEKIKTDYTYLNYFAQNYALVDALVAPILYYYTKKKKFHHPLYCTKRPKNGQTCNWQISRWLQRKNLILYPDHVGYLTCPDFFCTTHNSLHSVSAHSVILDKEVALSEKLIKIDRYFVHEDTIKLQFSSFFFFFFIFTL